MKGKIKIVLLIVILIFAAAAAFLFAGNAKTLKSAEVTIDEGSGTMDIAKTLKEEGVIRSEAAFVVQLRMSEYAGKLQYGTYEIKKDTGMKELFRMLATQGAKEGKVNVTIPEGFSVEQIGDTLEKKGLFSKKDFLKAANTTEGYDFAWLKEIKSSSKRNYLLQGYLYPDTYNLYKTATPEEVVSLMLSNFETHIRGLDTEGSLDRIVTEASVIERETSVDSERPLIAGVIENRLKENMKLQIDVTVLYPLTDGMYDQNRVSYEDLKVDSPYNTYKNKGLPVGPICNPSVESIKAAAQPEQHEYLYYHTKSKGSKEHNFYKTYKEHIDSQGK
ncbi:MAG: endolytic transglycosylase MltG [Lachnospiraceae bacterium]|nr:endolytic transglycosylase MltG [Lachnospiraceae bacterium]